MPCIGFSRKLKQPLRSALALRAARTQLDEKICEEEAAKTIDDRLTHHLRNRILLHDDNQRLLNGVGSRR